MKKDIIIDLKNQKTKKEIICTIAEHLGLTNVKGESWDAFSDELRSLDTQSSIFAAGPEDVCSIHLVLQNIDSFRLASEEDNKLLLSVLDNATLSSERNDGFEFSFVVDETR